MSAEPAVKLLTQSVPAPRLMVDAAALVPMVRLSLSTIKRLVSDNSIPHCRIGRAVRFPVATIERWIAAGCPRAWKACER